MTAKDDRIQELETQVGLLRVELGEVKAEINLALLDAPKDYKESLADYVGFLEEGLEFAAQIEKELQETLRNRDAIIQRLDDGWKPYFPKPDGDPVWYKTDAMHPDKLIALHRMTDAERTEYHAAIAAPEEHNDSDAHTN